MGGTLPSYRAKRRFSQFPSQASCNQEQAYGLEQALHDEALAVVAERQAFVLQQPGVAALHRPALPAQPGAVRLAFPFQLTHVLTDNGICFTPVSPAPRADLGQKKETGDRINAQGGLTTKGPLQKEVSHPDKATDPRACLCPVASKRGSQCDPMIVYLLTSEAASWSTGSRRSSASA